MPDGSASAFLEVTAPLPGRIIVLDQGATWRIGRSDQCEVCLRDDLISRKHAVIQRMGDGQFYLIDLGSRNGSVVNDVRISVPLALKDKDTISIGPSQMIFRCPELIAPHSELPDESLDKTRVQFLPRLITVLVIDIRDFTRLTQQLDQSVMCSLIATWFSHSGRIVRQRGSWSQKYIGDAIMAVWLHQSPPNERQAPISALLASAEIEEATNNMQARFSLPAPLRVGVGINTGFASLGNAGTGDVIDFTAMGDAVNAAFRMESATKQIGVDVAIGKSTYEMLSEDSRPGEYFQPHAVSLKGYECPADIWGAQFAEVHRFLNRPPGEETLCP
ncbi:MAG: adenylate/guanylate cyclase domain-containing protein [Acidobacteria bacterium]|nr:adenylate/guanylate cyclase domain-containing protein [Acidobacteriota bacterium]